MNMLKYKIGSPLSTHINISKFIVKKTRYIIMYWHAYKIKIYSNDSH